MFKVVKRNKLVTSLLSTVLFAGLVAPTASASITTASASINIGSIGSSKYDVEWSAKTANSGEPRIYVSANVYFNSVKKDSDSSYGASSVKISNTLLAYNNVRGEWEINSTHKEYDGTGKMTDIDSDYDSVEWDPAAALTLSNKESVEDVVLSEITSSFSLDLDGFDSFRAVQVGEVNVSDSLKDIVVTVMDNQEEGDIMPLVFVNEESDEAYILEKKVDGTNLATFLTSDGSGNWEVKKEKEKKGKKINK